MATKEAAVACAIKTAQDRSRGRKFMMAPGLRVRFFLVFVGLAVGPILLVALLLGSSGYSIVNSQSQQFLDIKALQLRNDLEAFFRRITDELTLSFNVAGPGNLDPSQRAATLQSLILRSKTYQDIYVLDPRGTVLEWYSRTDIAVTATRMSFANASIFRRTAAALQPKLGEVRINETLREPLVLFAIPFIDPYTGELREVLLANVRIKAIWNLLAGMDRETGIEAYVADSAGRVIAHRNPTVAMRGMQLADDDAARDSLPTEREVLSAKQKVFVHGTALTVAVEQDRAAAQRFADRFLQITLAVPFGALAIAVLVFLYYQRGVISPLSRLMVRIDRLRKGDYQDDVIIGGYGEVRMLADNIGKLIDELKHAREQNRQSMNSLAEKNRELESKIKELRVSEARAEAANRTKSAFLANMSHELRTPLNAILGFSEIIKNQLFGPVGNVTYLSYAKDVHSSGQHLLDLVNDILDLSRIESGIEELHEEEIDITSAIRSLKVLVEQQSQERGLELVWDVPDNLPLLRGDKRKLTQILLNLLTNAIKFTEAGGKVTLKAWCRGNDGFVFQVIDTGIGIAPEDIPKALSQFGQVNRGRNYRHEGAGLGLPLAKSLGELHGGSLNLKSELGVGTTVTLRIPATRIIHLPSNAQYDRIADCKKS